MAKNRSDNNSKTGSSHGSGNGPPASAASGLDREKLENAIRGHVVSRLKSSRPDSDAQAREEFGFHQETSRQLVGGIGPSEVLEALLDPRPEAYNRILDEILEREGRLKHVCAHIIAPIANELGRLWQNDQASFTQISLASGRMSVMIHQISASRRPQQPGRHARSILFGRLPGADHTLGLSVVSACFREAGWDVDGGADFCIDNRISGRIEKRGYTVLGISVGRTDEIERVGTCINKVSQDLANRRPLFGIGGAAVHGNLDKFGHVHADFIASDAWEALSMAEECVE